MMVKGISKQVILVHAPEEKLFEQAIFILNEKAVGTAGVTDEALMKAAKKLIGSKNSGKKRMGGMGLLWALCGAAVTGLIWLVTVIL